MNKNRAVTVEDIYGIIEQVMKELDKESDLALWRAKVSVINTILKRIEERMGLNG